MSLEGDFEPKGDRPVLLILVPLASGAACGLAAVVWGRGFWRWLSATMDQFWWWRASRR